MTGLGEALADYLASKGAGLRLTPTKSCCGSSSTISTPTAATGSPSTPRSAWARSPPARGRELAADRLPVVRGFAGYLHAFDPATRCHRPVCCPAASRRAVPYLYSDADIAALMAGRRAAHPAAGGDSPTLIGLLAVTGMRVGEAIGLDDDRPRPAAGVLTVRTAKFGKIPQLPLHPSTVDALTDYRAARSAARPGRAALLVISPAGTGCTQRPATFRGCSPDAGLRRAAARRPSAHDLRHSFAVRTLLGWYRDGVDVARRLPLLSTYLGHVSTRRHLLVSAGRPRADGPGRRAARTRRGSGDDRARPDPAGVLHRPALRATARQPAHRRRLPRHVPAAAAFARHRTGKQPSQLDLDDLDADLLGAFLDHLETRARQHRAHPQRPPRRDPLAVPLRRLRHPEHAATDRARPRDPDQALRPHVVTFLTDPRSTRCSPPPTAPPGSDVGTTPCSPSPSRPGCASPS